MTRASVPSYESCYRLRVRLPDGSITYELSEDRYSPNGCVLGYKEVYRCKVTGREVKNRYKDYHPDLYRHRRDSKIF